ncbi:MAG: ArsR family transcriptional regulator [Rhodothermales bacterium]|jgi:ArsR family transcriptional regulator
MTQTKPTSFTDGQQAIARWAKVLGHPARIAILEILARRGGCICGELVDELPLAQATVSQHLKALKESGLIEGTIDGPRSCYSISTAAFAQMKGYLGTWVSEQACACGCC